jgi:hypothetical protein
MPSVISKFLTGPVSQRISSINAPHLSREERGC